MGSRRIIQLLVAFSTLPLVSGCASPSAYEVMEERRSQARPSPATYWTDSFYATQPSAPERPVQQREFFKRCDLVRRDRYPSRSEWSCSEP